MASCELTDRCAFFNDKLPDHKGLAETMKAQYCKGNWKACARYIISQKLGRRQVPINLYPDMIEQAEKLLVLRKGSVSAYNP